MTGMVYEMPSKYVVWEGIYIKGLSFYKNRAKCKFWWV